MRTFAIERWKAQLKLCRIACAAAERKFESAPPNEKTNLLTLWNDAIRDREFVESVLLTLEREEDPVDTQEN
jgi:hypothetical protein